jgi:hypothetical protein
MKNIMGKKVKNGVYTTGKKSFRVTASDKIVEIYAIDDVSQISLKSGNSTQMNKSSFETFLDRELSHYFWSEE